MIGIRETNYMQDRKIAALNRDLLVAQVPGLVRMI